MDRTPPWGLLVLAKPPGMTSHSAVRRAARALGAPRAGHAGTLDPLASGVLLVGLGKATRLLEYLVGHEKAYRAKIRLGEIRDTLDREGRLLETRPIPPLAPPEIEGALERFRGRIDQIPPAHSAIKVGGRPLYKRARSGEAVQPAARSVEIRRLELAGWDPPDMIVEVVCSKGTYVRSLARDLGEALGSGGMLSELVRVRSGPFALDDAVPLAVLEEEGCAAWQRVLPPERMVHGLERVTVSLPEARALTSGVALECASPMPDGDLAVLDDRGDFLAVARTDGTALRPLKVFRQAV